MPPKRNPLDQLPWRMRSETTFARLSSRLGGLSPVPTGPPHVWESRGPPFTSGCKSLASLVPTRIHFFRSRVAILWGQILHSIDTAHTLVIRRTSYHISSRPQSEAV